MTNLSYKVLIVLLLISRSRFLPSSSKQKCLAKLSLHVLDLKTSSPWSQTKAAPCFELKSCRMVHKRHYHHSQEQAVSNSNISTYITSRDSTPTCTQIARLLAFRKHDKLKNAALREDYRHDGAITELLVGTTALLETAGSVVAHVWPPEAQKHLKIDRGRTLRASAERTYGGGTLDGTVETITAIVSSRISFFVADLNTLMLNVYVTLECLPALTPQIPLDVF